MARVGSPYLTDAIYHSYGLAIDLDPRTAVRPRSIGQSRQAVIRPLSLLGYSLGYFSRSLNFGRLQERQSESLRNFPKNSEMVNIRLGDNLLAEIAIFLDGCEIKF